MGDGRGTAYLSHLLAEVVTAESAKEIRERHRKPFALVDASREIRIRLHNALELLEAMEGNIYSFLTERQDAKGHQVRAPEPEIPCHPVEVILRRQIVEQLLAGLSAPGSHHKQYYLEEALKLIALPGEFGEMKADHGWEDGVPE